MIAEYFTRRDAEIYASELAQLYGPDIHFDVVSMPDPVFGDTIWYVLGIATINGQMFAQYADERKSRSSSRPRKRRRRVWSARLSRKRVRCALPPPR